jgi:TetR/AcrR family transcriptional regulator
MGIFERREREKSERREAILDAAQAVFAEKGLQRATVDEIAARAELSKGTIYLYFKSRETLFLGVDLRALTELRERFLAAAESEEVGLERVRAIGRAYFAFSQECPEYFRIMSFVDAMDVASLQNLDADPLAGECNTIGQSLIGILAESVRAGIEDGSMAADLDPLLTSALLWGQSNGLIQLYNTHKDHMQEHGLDLEPLLPEFLRLTGRALAPARQDRNASAQP